MFNVLKRREKFLFVRRNGKFKKIIMSLLRSFISFLSENFLVSFIFFEWEKLFAKFELLEMEIMNF